jgi:hypothetical protein
MRQSRADWKHMIQDLLNGIESELRPSPPAGVRATLQTFRKALERDHVGRRRKQFERELESALQASPFLRRAAERYFSKMVPAAMASALDTLERAERVLKRVGKSKKQIVN